MATKLSGPPNPCSFDSRHGPPSTNTAIYILISPTSSSPFDTVVIGRGKIQLGILESGKVGTTEARECRTRVGPALSV